MSEEEVEGSEEEEEEEEEGLRVWMTEEVVMAEVRRARERARYCDSTELENFCTEVTKGEEAARGGESAS